MSRISEVPVYEQRDDEIEARVYNLWRRAKGRFGCPLRIPLVDYPGMVMLLEEQAWVCVDERQNELPVLAWVAFENEGRDCLHEPVKCKLNYYHFAASKIRAHSLELMAEVLEKRLRVDSATP